MKYTHSNIIRDSDNSDDPDGSVPLPRRLLTAVGEIVCVDSPAATYWHVSAVLGSQDSGNMRKQVPEFV